MEKLWTFLAKKTFSLIGGLLLGFGVPFGATTLSNPMMDFIAFGIPGILLISISFYYQFYHVKK